MDETGGERGPAPAPPPVPRAAYWAAAAFLLAVLVVDIGCAAAPRVFYDGFVWEYFAGPLAADATDRPVDGISEGYNPVSTVVYGVILAMSVGAIYLVLQRFQIAVDVRFTLAVLPFLLAGVVGRVLEDMALFGEPWVYLFISPIIYIVVGLGTLGALLWMAAVARRSARLGPVRTVVFASVPMWIFAGVYEAVWAFGRDGFAFMHAPAVPCALALAVMSGWFWYGSRLRDGRFDVNVLFAGCGVFVLGLGAAFLAAWPYSAAWADAYAAAGGGDVVYRPAAFAAVVLLAAAAAAAIWFAMRRLGSRRPVLAVMASSMTLLLLFGHMLDASATFVAIDFFDYWEKHVLPGFLIESAGTAAVMLPLKAAVVCLVVYMLDVLYRDDLKSMPNLVGLVKIAVLVLGLAPGARDVLRMGLGV